ncbi:MAG: arylsulfatase [Planctomycetes bacterium]|nr:arylsulfatase [Planctomycetota bacterium]
MKRNRALALVFAFAVCFWFLPTPTLAQEKAKRKPNIIVILADDLGYSDIGCYGGEIKTPNLDKLAKNGLRFTNFYNTARCCPSRASLMTGLYSHQAGVGLMVENLNQPGYQGQLNRKCVTIAEVLRLIGYRCYMIGKWHLTRNNNFTTAKDAWPLARGFDRFYGLIPGSANYFRPVGLMRDNTPLEVPKDGYYLTDAFSENAVQFIDDHFKDHKEEPFFLYTAYTAPHWPLHALKDDIARYRGKYREGWDVLRQKRHERMKELGIVDPKWKIPPSDAKPWDKLTEKERDDLDLRMAIYAAQVDRMDQGIGKIVAALKKTGQLDNTLILFLADNGGCAEVIERGKGGELGGPDSYSSYGQGWAWLSNAILRLFKHWVHGGGVSSPLVVHWPEGIPERSRGELRRQSGHLIDIMATCIDVSGAAYPKEYQGNKITPLEGKSLVPAFNNQPIEREAIYWEHEGNKAILVKNSKLVSRFPGPWELYDLNADRAETTDLAAREPQRVKELAAKWQAWAERADVLPLRPYGKPKQTKTKASTKTEFQFQAGDNLTGENVPDVAGKSISINADIGPKLGDGVILAHGGRNHGYALFIRDGRLAFAVRQSGVLTSIEAKTPLAAGKASVTALLNKNGTLRLLLDDKLVAEGKGKGAMPAVPGEGLQVGQDLGAAVADYQAPFAFKGDLRRVTLKLTD